MTATQSTGALSTKADKSWSTLNWDPIKASVFRFQVRIAKVEREGRKGKVKALQRLLTTSFYGKCLAVKRVTSSAGAKTPGIDNVTWNTDLQKMQTVKSLKRKGYKAQPLRRIYISKKSGKGQRPLSIPTLKCRAMQALPLFAIELIVEKRADPNAYGFRIKGSTHDAIEQCLNALGRAKSATFVLEGDIQDCFGQINHDWLLANISMDKQILRKFLKAGFMENGHLNPTTKGTPQGSVISPALTVLTLAGLENKLSPTSDYQRKAKKINIVSFADDFIVTAASAELLQNEVMSKLAEFLKTVGLELSTEKTKITPIGKGFDFLGFTIRKYKNGKVLTKPSKTNIKRFLKEIKIFIRKGAALPTDRLIHALNEKIMGWTIYYRIVSSKVFTQIDHELFQALKRWALKTHSRKGIKWIIKHYWKSHKGDNWRFYCLIKDKEGKKQTLFLKRAIDTKIRRHIKIVAKSNPFDPFYKDYFAKRELEKQRRRKLSYDTELTGLKIIQPYEGLSRVP
ncbi:group II intron reverse transcriptase/maturase [Candidatus Odyssella thessalonicensis]|uniref:group II intron reverse transcriptase/maturase n=1 Tax=Candidatus Odyssella thessalonicensis TaxID=84647 RepID=UPI000225AC87|nr:group II intron reverse transcriptase/maturase [Candidatus Odyssella thessalonicensis]